MNSSNSYTQTNHISAITRHWQGVHSIKGLLLEGKIFLSRLIYTLGKGFQHSFLFEKNRYDYFYHRYNMTWRSERAIEIPLIKKIFDQYKTGRVLEIGNVMSYYYPTNHDVVDKYEESEVCINKDAIDFYPKELYDFVFSISTFEHVGFDEKPEDPAKLLLLIKHIDTHCLKPGGILAASFPYGYNPHLDQIVRSSLTPFKKLYFLRRESFFNKWKQVDFTAIKSCRYNGMFPFANALVIGVFEKSTTEK